MELPEAALKIGVPGKGQGNTFKKTFFTDSLWYDTKSHSECTQVVIVVVSGMFLSVPAHDLRELAKVTICKNLTGNYWLKLKEE